MANPVWCGEPGDTGCFFRKPLLKKGMFENEKFSIKQIFDLQTYSLAYNPIFEAFDTSKIDEYAAQAKAYWGKTPAYKEFEEKSTGEKHRPIRNSRKNPEVGQRKKTRKYIRV